MIRLRLLVVGEVKDEGREKKTHTAAENSYASNLHWLRPRCDVDPNAQCIHSKCP
jgi:hypothetical protein